MRPLIVELADPTTEVTEATTVGDVLVGVFSFTGGMILVAAVLALLFAGVLIGLRRRSASNPLSGDETSLTGLGLRYAAYRPPEERPSSDQYSLEIAGERGGWRRGR